MLLLDRDATVTICHSKTKSSFFFLFLDPHEIIKTADILIACCGVPNYIKGSWLKEGVVVIDVGINSIEDKSKKLGYKLVGDVDFNEAIKIASLITKVPG
jgi:methylenetetrahydrofolate dehydrogenase (NADP+) / methenyltetrahydrofolate cyclohydrolase / formyltetrahydrofolate synthetase